ncbi:hypothetical protein H6G89_03090 [Oscillatoria sp. FACHB-1407]|uniref:hypothetical protein n=1 Tax=Oscillatoria sp. FACHB-1407 TaxID=2692847 RepID=UPI0016872C3F|nr:hypothetical protein [Oscillatoria sp. FACHB-1407]MBD2460021.1 hypothetical protein [Oscillatoria sp. FACHB-1407]
MKRFAWIAAVAAVVLGSPQVAQADEGLLEFDLPESNSSTRTVPDQELSAIASQPTLPDALPADSALAGGDSVTGNHAVTGDDSVEEHPLEVSFELPTVAISTELASAESTSVEPGSAKPAPVATALRPAPISAASPQPTPANASSSLFDGGSDSLVAKAVGSAEGTRTPDGGRTWAYYGHVDPGNGVWNIGSFSYQHGAKTPEEADEKQLRRLQRQAVELRHQATEKGFEMTLEEELNGIDLANQSPAAALDRGYIIWLNTARHMGLTGSDAVLWARTRSYLDPDSGRWSAPGLGNNIHSITQDQERRMNAVNRAIALHQQQTVASEEVANRVIFEDLQ